MIQIRDGCSSDDPSSQGLPAAAAAAAAKTPTSPNAHCAGRRKSMPGRPIVHPYFQASPPRLNIPNSPAAAGLSTPQTSPSGCSGTGSHACVTTTPLEPVTACSAQEPLRGSAPAVRGHAGGEAGAPGKPATMGGIATSLANPVAQASGAGCGGVACGPGKPTCSAASELVPSHHVEHQACAASSFLRSLRHRFLVCTGYQAAGRAEAVLLEEPLIVEPRFKEQFLIANPTLAYEELLQVCRDGGGGAKPVFTVHTISPAVMHRCVHCFS